MAVGPGGPAALASAGGVGGPGAAAAALAGGASSSAGPFAARRGATVCSLSCTSGFSSGRSGWVTMVLFTNDRAGGLTGFGFSTTGGGVGRGSGFSAGVEVRAAIGSAGAETAGGAAAKQKSSSRAGFSAILGWGMAKTDAMKIPWSRREMRLASACLVMAVPRSAD
ncbi:MAG: hypothetical protein KKA54_03175 [Proteobacteria bacterium]|nr:hypothetical protein [Pseudomonadota bacterium]